MDAELFSVSDSLLAVNDACRLAVRGCWCSLLAQDPLSAHSLLHVGRATSETLLLTMATTSLRRREPSGTGTSIQ